MCNCKTLKQKTRKKPEHTHTSIENAQIVAIENHRKHMKTQKNT